ncbi:hypothetical protein [Candidatus Magnetaquiglobus chichijimensis]|uniref:hypothetical protein n=1 Tax=Candidatus Magnetaquiglobus chichijimensis TaxID=3141448 RepID=UPI003B96EFC4
MIPRNQPTSTHYALREKLPGTTGPSTSPSALPPRTGLGSNFMHGEPELRNTSCQGHNAVLNPMARQPRG